MPSQHGAKLLEGIALCAGVRMALPPETLNGSYLMSSILTNYGAMTALQNLQAVDFR